MNFFEALAATLKVLLAALLFAVIITLSGLTVSNALTSGSTQALLAAHGAAATAALPAPSVESLSSTLNSPVTAVATQQVTPVQPQTGSLNAQSVVKAVEPAVVTVVNTTKPVTGRGRFGSTGQTGEAYGSGVIISAQGYIVTNQHVVDNEQSLQVIFSDGTKSPATLVGADANRDIAVIKVDGKVPAVAQFGDSDTLEAGQPVIAIGSALGSYANTVTEGVISGLHRSVVDPGTGAAASSSLQDLVQTDAAINHGNSGGPLLDMATGKIIGINTAVVRMTGSGYNTDIAEGLGFAIPGNTARSVADQLIKGVPVTHP